MKDYLIICNSPEDQKFADRLKSDLRAVDIPVWGGAGRGDSKHVVGVAEVIRQASSFIYVCSQYSVKSSMLKMELAAASRANVPIIMIAIDRDGFKAVKSTHGKVGKVDFCRDYDSGLQSLVELLKGQKETEKGVKPGEEGAGRYLFLSYAEVDTPYMEEVKTWLAKKGYAFWEFQGSNRDYQAGLGFELEKVLCDAIATLSILSPGWKMSKWSMKEFMFSQQVGKPVFLLRFQDAGPTLLIADTLYIDFVEDKSKGFELLEKELKSVYEKRESRVP